MNRRAGRLVRPQASNDQLPLAVSLDRLQFGFECANLLFDSKTFDVAHAWYVQAGKSFSRQNTQRLEYRLPIAGPDGKDIGIVNVNMTIRAQVETTMRVEGSIRVNPLRCLRAAMPLAQGLVGLDGNDNVCGPTDTVANVEGKCLAIVEAAVLAVTESLAELFSIDPPRDECCSLWVQACEVTRDLDMPDAQRKAHRLLAAALRGYLYVERGLYGGPAGGSLEAGFAVVRAYRRKTGAALKAYAKHTDIIRVEWVVDERRDVRAELLPRRVALSPLGAATLMREAVDLARPELAEFQTEVLDVCRSTATPLDVMRALQPLYVLATVTAPARGPQPAVSVREEAAAAYDSLLLTGQCTLPPCSSGGRLRDCLMGLTAVGTLVRQSRRLCFALRPALAAAMAIREFPERLDDAFAQ